MHILIMRFDAGIDGDERIAIREGSVEKFRALPGLIEKYYLGRSGSPAAGGIYLFDTREHLQDYLDGPIVPGIQPRYQTKEAPTAQVLEVSGEVEPGASAGNGQRDREIGLAFYRESQPEATPPYDEVAAYAAGSGLERLFWVREPGTGRRGIVGIWTAADDVQSELRSPAFAGISGSDSAQGAVEYETYELARVLREDA